MLVLATIIALSTFSGVLRLPPLIYLFCIFLFFVCFVCSYIKTAKVGYTSLLVFVLICLLSILINNPPSYFKVWERLFVIIMIFLSFTPIIVNNEISKKRMQLFKSLLIVMTLFSFGSFFAYFLGINYFVRAGVELDASGTGHFSGLTNHSMMLAPISSLSSIYCFSKILSNKSRNKLRIRWIAIFITVFGALLLSASRGAFGGAVLGILVLLFRYNSGKLSKTIKYLFVVLIVGTASFPIWGGLSSALIDKQTSNVDKGGVMYSREAKMGARLYEIQNNFFTGVGFCVVDEIVDSVDKQTGTIEPNSSWLGVFSMTGIFGFITFLYIFIKTFKEAYLNIIDNNIASLMCGILAFFFVHLIIEGYVLAGGNILCGLFWLAIGASYSQTRYFKIHNR